MDFEGRVFCNEPLQIINIYCNFIKDVQLFYNGNMTKQAFLVLKKKKKE